MPLTETKPSTTITREQVLEELEDSIESLEYSYKEPDGEIRDIDALHSIACLREAHRLISTHTI